MNLDRDHPPLSQEQASDRLREHGVAPTEQRIEIARVLFSCAVHLSADQILARVNAVSAQASKATVYNTLKLFREKGLLREVIVDPNRIFYDPNMSPHYHFYDVDTGVLTDIPAERIRISGVPQLPAGTVEEGVEIVIRTRSARPPG